MLFWALMVYLETVKENAIIDTTVHTVHVLHIFMHFYAMPHPDNKKQKNEE